MKTVTAQTSRKGQEINEKLQGKPLCTHTPHQAGDPRLWDLRREQLTQKRGCLGGPTMATIREHQVRTTGWVPWGPVGPTLLGASEQKLMHCTTSSLRAAEWS